MAPARVPFPTPPKRACPIDARVPPRMRQGGSRRPEHQDTAATLDLVKPVSKKHMVPSEDKHGTPRVTERTVKQPLAPPAPCNPLSHSYGTTPHAERVRPPPCSHRPNLQALAIKHPPPVPLDARAPRATVAAPAPHAYVPPSLRPGSYRQRHSHTTHNRGCGRHEHRLRQPDSRGCHAPVLLLAKPTQPSWSMAAPLGRRHGRGTRPGGSCRRS